MIHPPQTMHGIIIPSYNSGALLKETLHDVLGTGIPVIVVIDGSTDSSVGDAESIAHASAKLEIIRLPNRTGKGGAILAGLEKAQTRGWTHAAVFDADGQHDAADIPRFMEASRANPDSMILGLPVFGPDAPLARVLARRLGNFLAHMETRSKAIGDSLFGFRVYPVRPVLDIMRGMRAGRGFDFDTRMAVQLCWSGLVPVNVRTCVRYLPRNRGISHFSYVRDNILLARTHVELLLRSLLRRRGMLADAKLFV